MGLINKLMQKGKGLAIASSMLLAGCLTTPQEAARLTLKPLLTGNFEDWDKEGEITKIGNSRANYKKNQSQKLNTNSLIFERLKIAEKDGLFLGIWIDMDKDGYVDVDTDSFQEVNKFRDGDRIFFLRKTPKNYTSMLRIRDSNNLFAIVDADKVEGTNGDAIYTPGIMPIEFIQRNYSDVKGEKKLYFELINEKNNNLYASKEIVIDFK